MLRRNASTKVLDLIIGTVHRPEHVPDAGYLVTDRPAIVVHPASILGPPQCAAADLDRVHAV